MTSNINIISADITICDGLTHFWDANLKQMRRHYYTDAIVGPSYQHFGNAVNIKVEISIIM